MAKPRVFVSSTHYDLKYIRALLDLFIGSFGFESVLSEKGNIPYSHDVPPDESCYREAENSDIFVLIVGGRYGSEANNRKNPRNIRQFYDRYESITKKEFDSAVTRDIPVFILIESKVFSEYQTFLRNKDRADITYAHVDSVNVFGLIEYILTLPRNNPVHSFEKFEDIENWLREQWSGLFQELLRRQSDQLQLSSLTTQVAELKALNETLRKYLEAVMTGADKPTKTKLIESEERRLEKRQFERLRSNRWIEYIVTDINPDFDEVHKITQESTDIESYLSQITRNTSHPPNQLRDILLNNYGAQRDLNETRDTVGAPRFLFKDKVEQPLHSTHTLMQDSQSIDTESTVNTQVVQSIEFQGKGSIE
jgi:hypothetical protein